MKPFNERGISPLLGVVLLIAGLALAFPPVSQVQEPPPPSGGTLRVEVNVVNVYCTVSDKKGRLIANLDQNDFEIREDGKKQELRYFARETDRPLTLGLLVDTSISQRQVLVAEKETGAQFLRQVLRPSDLAMLITFDVNVDLLQDFTQQAAQLEEALGRARINTPVDLGPFPSSGRRGTRLYDAVYLASKEKLGAEVGRKAIILVSDGVDAGSRVDDNEALEAAHRAEVIVYSIGIADPEFYGGATGGRGILKKLAEETGGRAFFPRNSEKLQEAFDQIADELRSQYALGYTPTNRARDGKFRKIEVKVEGRGLKVRARRGYYAPRS